MKVGVEKPVEKVIIVFTTTEGFRYRRSRIPTACYTTLILITERGG
jgi:hypothetical protein